jgi:hypothetical protein
MALQLLGGEGMKLKLMSICLSVFVAITANAVEIEKTKEKPPITISADSDVLKHTSIIFNYSTENHITMHNDGRVEIFGNYDTSTLLFWENVTRIFPDFKESICGVDK